MASGARANVTGTVAFPAPPSGGNIKVNGMSLKDFRRKILLAMLNGYSTEIVKGDFDDMDPFAYSLLFDDYVEKDNTKGPAVWFIDAIVAYWYYAAQPVDNQNTDDLTRTLKAYGKYTRRFEQRLALAGQLSGAVRTVVAARGTDDQIRAIGSAFEPMFRAIGVATDVADEFKSIDPGNSLRLAKDKVRVNVPISEAALWLGK